MIATRTVAATIEPLSLSDVKEHLRVDDSDEDRTLRRLIAAARSWGEGFTRRAFITQTWTAALHAFPACIALPVPPLQSVTSIAYVDGAGDTQTLSTSVYTVDTDSQPGLVYLAYGQSWPSTRSMPKAVTVTYVAGYGATETSVPEDVRSGLLLHVARLYEAREPLIVGSSVTDMAADESMLRPYQVAGF